MCAGNRIERISRLHMRFGFAELADQVEFVPAGRSPARKGQSLTVLVDGRPVLVGTVTGRRVGLRPGDRSETISGFSTAQSLVKSSVVQPRRTWKEISLRRLTEVIVSPFNIGVDVDPSASDIADEPFERVRCQAGEKVLEFLTRISKRAGCLITSGAAATDPGEAPRATVMITRIGSRTSPAITYPHPRILELDLEEDLRDRHSHYYVNARGGGIFDRKTGTLVGKDGKAEDPFVPYSPLIVQAETGTKRPTKKQKAARTQSQLDLQAEGEMRRRAAESVRRSITISGWSPAAGGVGELWAVNSLMRLNVAEEGIENEEMLITAVEFDVDVGREAAVARLELTMPDAFSIFQEQKLRGGGGDGGYHVSEEYLRAHGELMVNFDARGKKVLVPTTALELADKEFGNE